MGFAVTTYPNITPVVGLLSAQADSQKELLRINSSQTTLGVNSERYNMMLEPCQVMDNTTLGYLNDISTDKNSIISLSDHTNFQTYSIYYGSSSAAESATETLFDDVLTSVEAMSNLNFIGIDVKSNTNFPVGASVTSSDGGSGIVAIEETSSVGVAFSVIIKSVSGSFGIGSTIFLGSPGVAFTTLSSLNYVGTGQIYPDNTIITYYPDLEPPNTSVDNPFGNEQLKVLVNGTKGIGVANTFYKNSLTNPSTLGGVVQSDDSISSLGTVYTFDTVSGSSVKSSVDSLISSIDSDRTNLVSFNSGSSTIKGYKKGYSVNMWSLNKSNVDIQTNISGLEAAINILNDPANGGPY